MCKHCDSTFADLFNMFQDVFGHHVVISVKNILHKFVVLGLLNIPR